MRERDDASQRMSAWKTRGLKVLSTLRYPGSAYGELTDVEIAPQEEIGATRADVEALIVANEPVPFERLPSLRLVANFGVGVARIDLAESARRGIAVTNTPGVLDAATADLALALMLAVRRRVVEGDRLVRTGAWRGSWAEGFLGRELTGSTVGILGLGRIGGAVARRLRGFDARVLYPQRTRVETEIAEYRGLDELLGECDVVTIHTPRTPETEGMIDAPRLA